MFHRTPLEDYGKHREINVLLYGKLKRGLLGQLSIMITSQQSRWPCQIFYWPDGRPLYGNIFVFESKSISLSFLTYLQLFCRVCLRISAFGVPCREGGRRGINVHFPQDKMQNLPSNFEQLTTSTLSLRTFILYCCQ